MARQDSRSTFALPPTYSGDPLDVIFDDIIETPQTTNVNAWILTMPPDLYVIPEAKEDYNYETRDEANFRPNNARKSVLSKGLQVPTRFRSPTSRFQFPRVLEQAGVDRVHWEAFTQEVNDHAALSASQWTSTVAGGAFMFIFTGLFIGLTAIIPAGMYGHISRKGKELENIGYAAGCGALQDCVDRWNNSYFNSRNLAVRVDIPGSGRDMSDMDISTSKLYKHQKRIGTEPNAYESDHEVRKCQRKEGAERVRALRKCRIIVLPINPGPTTANLVTNKPKIEKPVAEKLISK